MKQLLLAEALTLPEATVMSMACQRMAARRADASLLTNATGILSGMLPYLGKTRKRDWF